MINMEISRVFAVAARALRQVVRDRRTFVMILAVPIVVMLVFGFAIGGEVEDAPIAVVIDDAATISFADRLLEKLKKDSRLDVSVQNRFSQAKKDVDSGDWYCPVNRNHKTVNDIKSV